MTEYARDRNRLFARLRGSSEQTHEREQRLLVCFFACLLVLFETLVVACSLPRVQVAGWVDWLANCLRWTLRASEYTQKRCCWSRGGARTDTTRAASCSIDAQRGSEMREAELRLVACSLARLCACSLLWGECRACDGRWRAGSRPTYIRVVVYQLDFIFRTKRTKTSVKSQSERAETQ